MPKRCILIIAFCVMAGYAICQCPEKDRLWKRLTELASNASATLSKDEISRQLHELIGYEASMKSCSYSNDSTHVLLLQRIGAAYYKQGELVKAIEFTQRSNELIRANFRSVIPTSLIRNYYNLSLYYDQLKKTREKFSAIDSCIDVASRFKAIDYYYLFALSQKVEHLFNIGDYERCYEFAETGENAIKTLPLGSDSINYVITFAALKVNVLLSYRQYASAKTLLANKIEDCIRMRAIQHLGPLSNLMGLLYVHQHDEEKAYEFYLKALKYNLSQGFNLGCMQTMNNLGYNLYFKEKHNPNKAIPAFRAALSYRNNDSTYRDIQRIESLNIMANIAAVYVSTQHFDSAFYYYTKAFAQVGNGIDENSLSKNLDFFISNKRTGYLTGLVIDKANAFLQKYKCFHNRTDLQEAISVFKAADRLLDRLRAEQQEAQSKLFWRNESRRLYEGAIEACMLQNDGASTFYFFEKSRAVLLQDQLAGQRWLGEKDILMQAQLKKQILQLQREMSTPEIAASAKADLQKEIFAKKQDMERLQNSIRNRNPLYFQSFLDTAFISLQQVRKDILNNREALLEIFTGDSAVYTLLITKEDITCKKINITTFQHLVDAYRLFLSDPDRLNKEFSHFTQISRSLCKLLFPDKLPPPGRMIISPDNEYFPFEALLSSAANETPVYLVNSYAFSYIYSARFLLNQFNARTGDSKTFLGMAPIDFVPALHLAPLPGSDKSLQRIAAHFSDAQAVYAEQATKKDFDDNFYKYKIVHLYAHATDSSNTGEPAIYFSDSALYLSDLISTVNPATRLLVLSACKTGKGKLHEGEGVFSFNRQFAAMGIPSSIINLWSVDNQATYELTEAFYKFLAEGLPADVALQKARLEFLHTSDKENQLPYYWAAMVLAGKSEAIPATQDQFKTVALVAAILLACGLLFYFRKRIIFRPAGNAGANNP